MNIDTALILCAGYGKRLNPLTLKIPKPLLKINNITLLENTIELIKNLEIKKIKINTFYLQEEIKKFIKEKNFEIEIEVISDGDEILDTGGGILNMIKSTNEQDFLVFNPDTIWNLNYLTIINQMKNFYFSKLSSFLAVFRLSGFFAFVLFCFISLIISLGDLSDLCNRIFSKNK